MATQTTNLGLTKPGYDEAADVVPAVNNNMDAIDAAMGAVPANTSVQAQITANAQAIAKLDESIAIVSNGNTHAAIATGQYVYIKGHGTLAEGLYTANSAISANATLSNSNVTAVSGGGLNALNSIITPVIIGGVNTLSATESAIQSIASTLGEGEQKNFTISFNSSFAPFNLSGGFSGRVTNRQSGGASWIAEIFNQLGAGYWHLGFCNGGTVTWKKLSMT